MKHTLPVLSAFSFLTLCSVAVLLCSCASTTQPEPMTPTCDVLLFQPHTAGSYWVYETTVYPEGRIETDSVVIDSANVTGNIGSYRVRTFVDGELMNTAMSGFATYGGPSPYHVESMPCMFYDGRGAWLRRDMEVQGPVLYCGMSLSPISVYLQLDSIAFVDSTGALRQAGVQYHVATTGTQNESTVGELSMSIPPPVLSMSTPVRRTMVVSSDTVMIQEPYYATFTNGQRFYASSSTWQRTYVYSVGVIAESLTQELGNPATREKRTIGYTRRLVRYGTKR